MQVLSLLVPLTKENMMVNNSQSSMDTKIEDINVKIVKNEGKIVKNTDSISDVKSIVEGHSAEISSLSEAEERQEKRTESLDNMNSQPLVSKTGTNVIGKPKFEMLITNKSFKTLGPLSVALSVCMKLYKKIH